MFSFALALIAIASGALVSYFYDRDAPLFVRLCAGVCVGFAALGLVGYLFASALGLTPLALAFTAVVVAAPLALLLRREWRERVRFDARGAAHELSAALSRPRRGTIGTLIFYALIALVCWQVFGRAMFERAGELYTGIDNNLGDLPFHLSIITSFVNGDNFPPQHPEFAGARLTYPFVVDFVAAMFVRAGASLEGALFWENFALSLSLIGLLQRFAWKLTRDRLAASVSVWLTFLSGGLGWWTLLREANSGARHWWELLGRLPHDYTIHDGYRWGNALTTLLVPQRGLLLGLPLALIVITLWWTATDAQGAGEDENMSSEEAQRARVRGSQVGARKARKERSNRRKTNRRTAKHTAAAVAHAPPSTTLAPASFFLLSDSMRRMIGAGIVAGMLPLVHAHSFVVLMLMGGCLALLFPRWREWIVFFAVALVIAAPQMWWATRGSAARVSSFFAWQAGWDHGEQNAIWFWLRNAGLFIPLLVATLLWRGREPIMSKRLLAFYAPFTLCFIISNVAKISPWVWDNIKVLFYWYVASTPLVALSLVRLWRMRGAWRVSALGLLISLTLAGGLDVWRVVSEASEQREFDREGVAFAELIKRQTPPRSLILNAPTYNHPVYLTGRASLMGYAGHLWSQGIDYAPREIELRRIYTGAPDAQALLKKYHVDYVVVSPLEQSALAVDQNFFARFAKVGDIGAYHLYKVTYP